MHLSVNRLYKLLFIFVFLFFFFVEACPRTFHCTFMRLVGCRLHNAAISTEPEVLQLIFFFSFSHPASSHFGKFSVKGLFLDSRSRMRWGGCRLARMSLWISALLCSVQNSWSLAVWVRLPVQSLFLKCLLSGSATVVYGAGGSVLGLCAVIHLWCPRALKHSPNWSTQWAIFIKPSGITIVALKICATVIEFIHLPGVVITLTKPH